MSELRVALIGCGGMGASLAKGCDKLPTASVVAVCDLDAERAQTVGEELDARVFTDYDEMFGTLPIDAVLAAPPNYLHRDIAIDIANAGKHLFLEKPMALGVEQCDDIIQACEQNDVRLMIGQVLRYIPPYLDMKRLVDEGVIGAPAVIRVCRAGAGWGKDRAPWRLRRETCGGILFEVNAHELDFMRYICGEVQSVSALTHKYGPGEWDYEDVNFVQLQFESGAIGHLYSSFGDWVGRRETQIVGDKGGLLFAPGTNGIQLKVGTEGPIETITPSPRSDDSGVPREVREFVEAVLNDEEPTIPGSEGRKAVEMAVAAYRSAEEGRMIELPLQ